MVGEDLGGHTTGILSGTDGGRGGGRSGRRWAEVWRFGGDSAGLAHGVEVVGERNRDTKAPPEAGLSDGQWVIYVPPSPPPRRLPPTRRGHHTAVLLPPSLFVSTKGPQCLSSNTQVGKCLVRTTVRGTPRGLRGGRDGKGPVSPSGSFHLPTSLLRAEGDQEAPPPCVFLSLNLQNFSGVGGGGRVMVGKMIPLMMRQEWPRPREGKDSSPILSS